MTERDMYKKLKKEIPGFYTRLENSISSGAPDTVAVINGQIAFIEFKTLKSGNVYFQPSQIIWNIKFYEAAGRESYLLVSSRDDTYRLYSMEVILAQRRVGFQDLFAVSLDNVTPIAVNFGQIKDYFFDK